MPAPTVGERLHALESKLAGLGYTPDPQRRAVMEAYYLSGARVGYQSPRATDPEGWCRWQDAGSLYWYRDYTYVVHPDDAYLLPGAFTPLSAPSTADAPAAPAAPALVSLIDLQIGEVAVICNDDDRKGAIVLCVYPSGNYKRLVCIDGGGSVGATRGRTTWSWDSAAEVRATSFRLRKINMTLEGLT